MVVDGVGNYSSDITEPGQLTEKVNPPAIRELLPVSGSRRDAAKGLLQPYADFSA
jgi:hypothetical protein